MEFGIGFITGGVLTGVVTANSGTIVKVLRLRLAKCKSAVQQKMAALAAIVKTKL